MIQQRTPVANAVIEGLQQETDAIGCISELRESAARLDVKGSGGDQLRELFPSRTLTSGRCLRCQTRRLLVGRTFALTPVGAALAYAPTAREYAVPPHLFRVLFLERLRLSRFL